MGGWAEGRSMVVTTAQCSMQREQLDARRQSLFSSLLARVEGMWGGQETL